MKIFGLIILMSCIFLMGYHAGYGDGIYKGAVEWELCKENGANGYYMYKGELQCIF